MKHATESPPRSLSERVVNAGAWSLGLRSALRLAGFVRNIVLARILAPEDFGLFGITLVVLSILERFSNTGLQAALVQKDQDVQEDLNTAWTIQMLRGTALGTGLVLGSSQIASFFNEPAVVALLQVLGVSVFLKGLLNPGVVYFRRDLVYKPQFVLRLGSTIIDLTVSIVFALLLQSVWALMIGMVAGQVTVLTLSYLLHPYRPRFRIHWGRARELGRFGRWIFLNNALFFLAYRGDNFVIGKLLGAPALGVYMLAYSISEVVTVEISRVITEIAFPAYSRIQGHPERLRRWYLSAIELVASVAAPVAVGLFLLAEPITAVLLGSRWLEVATVLPALALAGCARAITSNGGAVYSAVGRPSLSFRMNLIGVVVTYGTMFFLIQRSGLVGVAIAVAAGQLSMLIPFIQYSKKSIEIEVSQVGRRLTPALALSGVVGMIILGIEATGVTGLAGLLTVLVVACVGYIAAAAILWRAASLGPFHLVARFLPRRMVATIVPGVSHDASTDPSTPGI